jgi:hypothetical protein
MLSSLKIITNEGSGIYVNAKKNPDSIWNIIATRTEKPNTDENLKYGTKIIQAYFNKKYKFWRENLDVIHVIVTSFNWWMLKFCQNR